MFLRYPYVLRSPEGSGGGSSESAKPAPASAPVASQAPAVTPPPAAPGGNAPPATVPPQPPVPASAPVVPPAAPNGSQPPVPPVTDTPPTDPNKVTIGDKTYDLTKPEEAIAALEAKGKEFETQRATEQARIEQQTIEQKLNQSRTEYRKTNPAFVELDKQLNEILGIEKESGGETAATKALKSIFSEDTPIGKEIREALQLKHDIVFHQNQMIEQDIIDSGEKFVNWAKLSGVPIESLYTENPADADPRSFKFWAVLEKQGLLKHTSEGKSYFIDPKKVEAEFYKLFPKQGVVTLPAPPTNPNATASPPAGGNQTGPALTDEQRKDALSGKFGTLPPEIQNATVMTFANEELDKISHGMAPTKFNDQVLHYRVTQELERIKQSNKA